MSKVLADRYELIEKVGEGGMAYVYKGRDRLLNRFVAVKILRPEFTSDEKFVDNFIKESQAAASLIHPNIVGVYDVGNEGNIHYIVMELVTGKPLSKVIKEKGRIEYLDAIKIIKQIASALQEAHNHHIVHRDVKPHNVIITADGTAKLADFGIARAVSQSTIEKRDEKVMGSVHYFSPEQARGAYVDERSDIYSLGIVLFELLTGKVPFDGDTAVTIALKHINDPIPRVTDIVKGLPPKFNKIIEKATDKYQNNRYASADEMIKDLESIEYVSGMMLSPVANQNKETKKEETPVKKEKETTQKKKVIGRKKLKEEKKTKEEEIKKKQSKTLWIVLISICLIIAVGLVGLISGWFNSKKEILMPQLVGKTYEDAVNICNQFGLTLVKGEDVYSQMQEEGYVDSQIPSEGAKIMEGKSVTIYVSKGKRANAVPQLIGSTVKEAKKILEDNGFMLGSVSETGSEEEAGKIVYQSISAGNTAKAGTAVDVKISDGKGTSYIIVSNYVGYAYDEAKKIIEGEGLIIRAITYEETDAYTAQTVINQSIKEGTEVENGAVIDLVLAKEKTITPPVEEPGEEG